MFDCTAKRKKGRNTVLLCILQVDDYDSLAHEILLHQMSTMLASVMQQVMEDTDSSLAENGRWLAYSRISFQQIISSLDPPALSPYQSWNGIEAGELIGSCMQSVAILSWGNGTGEWVERAVVAAQEVDSGLVMPL